MLPGFQIRDRCVNLKGTWLPGTRVDLVTRTRKLCISVWIPRSRHRANPLHWDKSSELLSQSCQYSCFYGQAASLTQRPMGIFCCALERFLYREHAKLTHSPTALQGPSFPLILLHCIETSPLTLQKAKIFVHSEPFYRALSPYSYGNEFLPFCQLAPAIPASLILHPN